MVEMSKRVPVKESDSLKTKSDAAKKPVTDSKRRSEKRANELSNKAAKTQQEYEQDRTTISK